MKAVICLLRAVNLLKHNRISMTELRELCESLGLKQSRTYVQSGNVVFLSSDHDLRKLATRMETAIEKKFGFRPDVVLRTVPDLRNVLARNPFSRRKNIEASKLLVTFLSEEPAADVCAAVKRIQCDPEELHLVGRELYVYFAAGVGRSKLTPVLARTLKKNGTARNWNTVTKLLDMAEELERGAS